MRLRNLPLILVAAVALSAIARAENPVSVPASQPVLTPDEQALLRIQEIQQLQLQQQNIQMQQLLIQRQQQLNPVPNLPPLKFPANDGFQSDLQFSGPLDPLIQALHSSDYASREEASHSLLRMSFKRLPEIQAALAKETDVEAATRLTDVAAHLYLKGRTELQGPTSMLGIRLSAFELVHLDPAIALFHLDPTDDRLHMVVPVADLQPGFPAAQELRQGDTLVAIDGKLFPADLAIDDFRARVNAHRAGSVIPLIILRDGQAMEIGIQAAGVPPLDGISLDEVIAQRNQDLAQFMSTLKTAIPSEPLILRDQTPEPLDGPNVGPTIIRLR